MSEPNLEFQCAPGGGSTEILGVLAEHWRLAEGPTRGRSCVFYDTFDWALYADGGVLEWRTDPADPAVDALLVWSPLEPQAPPPGGTLIQEAPTEPGFAADLPAGPVRLRILKIAGIRRLLPVMRLSTRERTLRALDDHGQTLWRLTLEEVRFQDPVSGDTGELRPRLRVLPRRGRDDARDALLGWLGPELGLSGPEAPPFEEALRVVGRRPRDYSSKIDLALDPGTRADAVTKGILMGLLATIERNRAGARDNLDSEFLHDLRVAVRRTRSALTQIHSVLPASKVAHYKERFAWLQQITGPVRDLDVYLLDFAGYQASLPQALRPHLEPMRTFILAHYAEEQRCLAKALDGPELRKLLDRWRAFLESPNLDADAAAHAATPIKSVADARIWRMAKRVRREGQAIMPQSPATEMHELRKSCKKLRYLMEFFQSLYPPEEIRPLIRLLKDLLDNLGSFQDLAVQAVHLRDLATRMRAEGLGETDTLLAMGALIGQVLRRQALVRDSFATVFTGFLAEENQDRLLRLFRPDRAQKGWQTGEEGAAGAAQADPSRPDAGILA